MEHGDRIDLLETPLLALLAATESLFATLAGTPSLEGSLAESPEDWTALLDRRNTAFAELEQAASRDAGARPPVTAAARACLERIAELDRALLDAGREGLVRLQQERLALGSRRRAVLAHAVREREIARAVAVKA